jgi:hypothetical protein
VSDAEVVPDETLFEVYNKSVGRYMSVDADPVAHSPFDDSEEVTLDETPRRRKEDPNEGTYKRLAYREGHAIVTSADSWARLQENLNACWKRMLVRERMPHRRLAIFLHKWLRLLCTANLEAFSRRD